MSPIIAITGPTAVGKSAVADRVARALHTEVLSADAMQVYRNMDIGTAKTPVSERLVPSASSTSLARVNHIPLRCINATLAQR